jgi:hypothetical protein
MEITIVGVPGIVEGWRAAGDADLEAVTFDGNDDSGIGRLTERDLVLGWIGTVCDVKATLAVAPETLVITPAPREGCDSMGVGRGMVLTFADPVDPAAITVHLEDGILLPEES